MLNSPQDRQGYAGEPSPSKGSQTQQSFQSLQPPSPDTASGNPGSVATEAGSAPSGEGKRPRSGEDRLSEEEKRLRRGDVMSLLRAAELVETKPSSGSAPAQPPSPTDPQPQPEPGTAPSPPLVHMLPSQPPVQPPAHRAPSPPPLPPPQHVPMHHLMPPFPTDPNAQRRAMIAPPPLPSLAPAPPPAPSTSSLNPANVHAVKCLLLRTFEALLRGGGLDRNRTLHCL